MRRLHPSVFSFPLHCTLFFWTHNKDFGTFVSAELLFASSFGRMKQRGDMIWAALRLALLLVVGFWFIQVSAEEKHSDYPTREEIKFAVKEWERSLSGKPINCRRFVDLFTDNGYFHFPAPSKTLYGQRAMFRSCEESTFFSHFAQVETFVSGPLYFSGPNTVAFQHTFLFVTNETICRTTLHGIAVIEYQYYQKEGHSKKQVLIKDWKDYWDQEDFDKQLKGCSWPEVDEEQEKAAAEALKKAMDNNPYVIETEQRRAAAANSPSTAKLEL